MGHHRDQMDRELRIRGYSPKTRDCYLRCVRDFVGHFMVPPDQFSCPLAAMLRSPEPFRVPLDRVKLSAVTAAPRVSPSRLSHRA